MGNWFVFYVQTGEEQIACDLLNKLLIKEESISFIPKIKFIYKNSKFIRKELKPMFPGYVFTDSDLDERIFVAKAYELARFSKSIFRLLGNEGIDYMKVPEAEKNYLLGFYDELYVADESKGFIAGDKLIVTSGPLKGRESIIKRIDRHKKRAEIELSCFGAIKRISVALEITAKVL
jgi:transcriptional antiterminator NusG